MGKMIQLDSDGPFDAYLAPAAEGVPFKGALIVIEEIWGLTDHIKDVADRYAAQGYLVLSPDLIGHTGFDAHLGTELQQLMFSSDEKARAEAQPRMREAMAPVHAPEFAAWAVPALVASVDYLDEQPGVDGRIGVIGYCFGGSYAFALAAADSRVRAALPYYGQPPETAELENINAPILAFYGQTDERLITNLPQVTEAMEKAGVDFTAKVYEDTGHAFFNDTNPHTYNAADAADAWQLSLAFLDKHI
jgi:carboxymethylenebutenolidase